MRTAKTAAGASRATAAAIRAESIQQSLGSGVIVTTDGYIITNNHVVADADDVKIKFGEPQKEYKATIVGRDAEADVALLKIDATGLPAATLGDSDQLQGRRHRPGRGRSVRHRPFRDPRHRQRPRAQQLEDRGVRGLPSKTDAPINPGNSGVALFDSKAG